MAENGMRKLYICWINEEKLVLSFHKEESYVSVEFSSREELQKYILARTAEGYRLK